MAIKFLNTVAVDTNVLYVDAINNRVGIGTNNPDAKLSVSDDGQAVFEITPFTNDYGTTLRSYDTVDETFNYLSYKASIHTFYIGDAAKVRINSSGNVGIGTTSPSEKLHVVGNAFLSANSAFKASYNNTDSYHGSMRWAGLQLGNNGVNKIVAGRTAAGGSFQFWTNNTNDTANYTVTADGIMTMAMTNAGNVGIGTTNPASKLDVQGGMSQFSTTLTNNEDWENSPISINERGQVGSAQSADKYAPNLNFHWAGRASKSLWLGANGQLNFGEYSAAGIPANPADGQINSAIFYGDHKGTINTATTGTTQTAGNNSTKIATTAYADAAAGAVPIGNYLPLAGGTMTGVTQFNDHTQHGDQVSAKFGAGNDLQIYHDGSNSYIDNNTGNLTIDSGVHLLARTATGESLANFYANGANELFYDNSKKFETTSTGVTVTGEGIFTGNVGIGTTSPTGKLDVFRTSTNYAVNLSDTLSRSGLVVKSSGAFDSKITFSSGASSRQYIQALNNAATTGRDISINPYGGNVGIGTDAPTSGVGSTRILKVSSNGNSEVNVDHTDGGTSSDIGLFSFSRNGDHLAHMKATHDGATNSAFMSFHAQPAGGSFSNASSNERMRITSIGRVGIGTTSPNTKLDVISGTNGGIRISATDTTSNWRDIDIRSYVSQAQANALPDGSAIFTTNPSSQTETAFSKYGGTVIQGRDDSNSSFAIRLGNGGGHATRMFMGATGETTFSNTVQASGYKSSDGSAGITGTMTFVDHGSVTRTITYKNGLVVATS